MGEHKFRLMGTLESYFPLIMSIRLLKQVRILAEENKSSLADLILNRIDISVNKHKSSAIAIAAHYDCAGNPLNKDEQLVQLEDAVEFLKGKYPGTEILGLWVDSDWTVEKVF